MKIVVEGRKAHIPAPIPAKVVGIATRLEGRKSWLKAGGGFNFEPTHFNLDLFRTAFPGVEIEDNRTKTSALLARMGQESLRSIRMGGPTGDLVYASRTQPYGDFQRIATEKGLETDFYALLMEQGLGKSKVTVDIAGTRWCRHQITGVLIIALNGVHHQWIEEAFPDHLGEMVPWRGWAYRPGKKMPEWLFKKDKLAVFTINFDSVHTKEGAKMIEAFHVMHGGRILGVVDEGQKIKNPDAKRSIEIFELAPYCLYRMDLTGTPIAKNLIDLWSQFKFLDPRALGYSYKSSFNAEFSVMMPKMHGVVLRSKNEEKFYSIIEPYCYRVTKAEALPGMPPKVYDKFTFELHPDQRKVYDKLRNEFRVEFDKGKVTTIKAAISLIVRLQQITCGYLALDKDDPDDATEFMELPNPRMDALKQVMRSRLGKKIVWCRFRRDIENGLRAFNNGVSYYGGDGRDEKRENKLHFINDPDCDNLWSNPASAGAGVDGLQIARTAIYYSQSHNAIDRWQSEDRIDRIGMGDGASYYCDLVARNTVDVGILRNHKKKKELSDLILDDIRMLLDDEIPETAE